ncbi:MAG: hypothetical protein H6907_05475 [Hyphomicrobiales bacterium]|nr:hypothetical protein [Hyphomicrobiales bacterium]MCP5371166.1 hypothetical protein [Hyphomicrobiales bacterium]
MKARIFAHAAALAGAATLAGLAGPAAAYCVTNQTAVSVHAVALDGSGFEADIAPGRDACAPGKAGGTHVLAVTGYVPVAANRRPGWQAECRIRLEADARALVRGDARRITCTLAK